MPSWQDSALPPITAVNRAKMTVYVIDDDQAVLESICLVLELSGFSVRPYASGEAFLRDQRPDGESVVVTDMIMPGLSGLEVIEQLRQEGNQVPAILITANLNNYMLPTAKRLGVAIIEKPLQAGELVGRIRDTGTSD
jgi:FixJ family two-component response regulator